MHHFARRVVSSQNMSKTARFIRTVGKHALGRRSRTLAPAPVSGGGTLRFQHRLRLEGHNISVGTCCSIPGCNNKVWVDPQTNTPSKWCGKTHKESASQCLQFSIDNTDNISSLADSACLWCRSQPKQTSGFCSDACADKAYLSAFRANGDFHYPRCEVASVW